MRHVMKLVGCLALFAFQGNAAISLVTHKIQKDLTGAEITALSTSGYNSTAGNLIVVWAVSYSGAQPVGSVTDSAGDVFTAVNVNKGTWSGQWFYAKNVKGESFNVVTIHPATTGRATLIYPGMNMMEYSGADPSSPLIAEVTGKQGALDGAWESSSFDAAEGELVAAGIVTGNGGEFTAGPGLKIENMYQTTSSSKFSFAAMDQIFSAAQPGVVVKVTWKGTLQATGSAIRIRPAH